MFISQYKTHCMPLKMQVQVMKKEDLSISDCFNKMKKFTDSLAIDINPFFLNDFIMHLHTGLDENYKSLVTKHTCQDGKGIIVEEVSSLILSHKTRMEIGKEKRQNEIYMIYQLILL